MNPDAYTEMARTQATHWWFAARRDILRGQLRQLDLPPDADILEIGSGTGANLDLLSEFCNVLGLEMESEAIALAKQCRAGAAGNVSMLQGMCPDDLPALGRKFDLICLFDVLEHIERDQESLSQLALLLKPHGRLMVTVPAYQWMWGPHDVHLHHKRRYNRRTLSERCDHAGLSIARMSHFNTVLFPLAVLARMVEKLTGRNSSATETPAPAINALFRTLFAAERHLLSKTRLPFGLSLLLLAQPRRPG
jgi:SAM-dependent methyltransferase